MTRPCNPDPIAMLLAEHRDAEAVFARFERVLSDATTLSAAASEAWEAARQMVAYLDVPLEAHIRKEEEPLFPRLKARLPADDRYVDELVAEHDQARIRREELRAALDTLVDGADHAEMRDQRETVRAAIAAADHAGPEGIDFTALRMAGRVLLRTLRVHFQNEEELAFPLARELLSADELVTVAQEMLAIDQEAGTMTTAFEQSGSRSPGETSGSPERPPQQVVAPLQSFDLAAEQSLLLQERSWLQGDRNAKTLIKQPSLRAVLTTLKAGTRLAAHQAAGPTTIQVLSGELRVQVGEETIALRAGQLLALEARLPHTVEAIDESTFLLTIAWPSDTA